MVKLTLTKYQPNRVWYFKKKSHAKKFIKTFHNHWINLPFDSIIEDTGAESTTPIQETIPNQISSSLIENAKKYIMEGLDYKDIIMLLSIPDHIQNYIWIHNLQLETMKTSPKKRAKKLFDWGLEFCRRNQIGLTKKQEAELQKIIDTFGMGL